MTLISKIVLSSIASIAVLSAATDAERVNQQITGSDQTEIYSSGEVLKKNNTEGVFNYNEVVYEHLKAFQSKASQPQTAQKIAIGENIKEKNAKLLAERLAAAAKEKKSVEEKASQPTWPKFVEGYCYVKNDIEVEKIATYAYLSCDFADKGGRGDLVVSLVPDFYANALVAKPLYITMSNKQGGKKQRIPITSGAVLTQDRLSINVANVVNDRKIAKLTATGVYTTLNVVTKQMQAYMADEKESRKKESINYNTTSGVTQTVSSSEQLPPRSSDYLVAAGVEVVSELAKVIGDSFIQQLPYTFKVHKDSILYVDAELSSTTGVRGYDPVIQSVVKRQPSFDITTGKETSDDKNEIPIREMQTQPINDQAQKTTK